MSEKKRDLAWFGDILFDFFSAALNVADVVSDVAIAYYWYQQKRYVFFWIAVIDFFASQVAYSVMFVFVYRQMDYANPRHSMLKQIATFLAIFPFAQLVPVIIWIQSYGFTWIDRIFDYFALDKRDDDYHWTKSSDALRNYIMRKLRVQGGFIIEAVVESVPQSILQMIAVVVYSESTVLDITSLAISIISVASRGFVMAYCIDRATFVFNFLCFVTDVILVFCVVSWLFFVPANTAPLVVSYFGDIHLGNVASLIWIWMLVAVGIVAAVICALMLASSGIEILDNNEYRRRYPDPRRPPTPGTDFFFLFLLFLFGLLVFPPGLVAIQALSLSFFPIVVFGSIGGDHSRNATNVRPLFDFLKYAPTRAEFGHRVHFCNTYFAKTFMSNNGCYEHANWQPARTPIPPYKQKQYVAALKILRAHEKDFSAGTAVDSSLLELWDKYKEAIRQETQYCNPAQQAAIWVMALVGVPVLFVTSLYSLIYPIISISLVPWTEVNGLQKLLTLALFVCYGLLLCLAAPAYQFWRCTTYLTTFDCSPAQNDVQNIMEAYEKASLLVRQAQTTSLAVLVSNASANSDNELKMHVVQLLPTIAKFAGFSELKPLPRSIANIPVFETLVSSHKRTTRSGSNLLLKSNTSTDKHAEKQEQKQSTQKQESEQNEEEVRLIIASPTNKNDDLQTESRATTHTTISADEASVFAQLAALTSPRPGVQNEAGVEPLSSGRTQVNNDSVNDPVSDLAQRDEAVGENSSNPFLSSSPATETFKSQEVEQTVLSLPAEQSLLLEEEKQEQGQEQQHGEQDQEEEAKEEAEAEGEGEEEEEAEEEEAQEEEEEEEEEQVVQEQENKSFHLSQAISQLDEPEKSERAEEEPLVIHTSSQPHSSQHSSSQHSSSHHS